MKFSPFAILLAAGSVGVAAQSIPPTDEIRATVIDLRQCYLREALALEPSGATVTEIVEALQQTCQNDLEKFEIALMASELAEAAISESREPRLIHVKAVAQGTAAKLREKTSIPIMKQRAASR